MVQLEKGGKFKILYVIESSSYQAHALHTNQGLRSFVNLWSLAVLLSYTRYDDALPERQERGGGAHRGQSADREPAKGLVVDESGLTLAANCFIAAAYFNLQFSPLLQVNGGTKLTGVVDYAVKAVKSGEYRNVLWTGSGGGGISKTVSCAEIMKRDFEMHQITRIKYSLCVVGHIQSRWEFNQLIDSWVWHRFLCRTEEDWDPQTEGLDPIVVKRYIPTIFIYLTLDEIDSKELGYQSSKSQTGMWLDRPRPAAGNGTGNRGAGGAGGGGRGGTASGTNSSQGGGNRNSNNNRRSRGGGAGAGANGNGNRKKTPIKNKNHEQGNGACSSSKSMKIDVPQDQ